MPIEVVTWASALLVPAAIWGCQSYGEIHTEAIHDERVDFAEYGSFAQTPPPSSSPGLPYDDLQGCRIEEWIGIEREARGLQSAPWSQADLDVAFCVDVQPRMDVWFENAAECGPRRASAAPYPVGSLAIDMCDRKRPVWHETATQQTLERDFDEEHAKRVVHGLMARFPPEG